VNKGKNPVMTGVMGRSKFGCAIDHGRQGSERDRRAGKGTGDTYKRVFWSVGETSSQSASRVRLRREGEPDSGNRGCSLRTKDRTIHCDRRQGNAEGDTHSIPADTSRNASAQHLACCICHTRTCAMIRRIEIDPTSLIFSDCREWQLNDVW
jgi:hypothetical protein